MAASTQKDEFRTFWSNGLAWGVFEQRLDQEEDQLRSSIKVLGGDLSTHKINFDGEIE
jgi:hypothetical protein